MVQLTAAQAAWLDSASIGEAWMRLAEFLRKLESGKRARVKARLEVLSTSSPRRQQVVKNLHMEARLNEGAWEPLCRKLLGCKPDGNVAEGAIRRFCRNHQFWGGPARIGERVTLGRAISQDWLIGMLREQGVYIDIDEARSQIQALIDMPPEDLPKIWGTIPMGDYILWSTFNPSDGQRPFGNPVPRASTILCMLGMLPKRGAVLLMQFVLPTAVQARIPTCCDAYAGEEWPANFQPAPEGAQYGRTLPADPCPEQDGRPEVVHEITRLDSLVKPLEYAL